MVMAALKLGLHSNDLEDEKANRLINNTTGIIRSA